MNAPISFLRQSLQQPVTVTATGGKQAVFCFSPDCVCFQGHFPGNPILPGVVQVMAAMLVATHGTHLTLVNIKRCKFMRAILPDERVIITVALHHTNGVVVAKAALYVDDAPCATLTFALAEHRA